MNGTSSQNKLKPCPFCGSQPRLIEHQYRPACQADWFVNCDECDFSLQNDVTADAAVKRWNRRVTRASDSQSQTMPITRLFAQTVRDRAAVDPEFAQALVDDERESLAASDYHLWLTAEDGTTIEVDLTLDQVLAISRHMDDSDGFVPLQGGVCLPKLKVSLQAFMRKP